METKKAVEHAGSATALAELLGITISAVSQWGECVPETRVWQLKVLKPAWFEAAPVAAVSSIKTIRDRLGITQTALGEALGCSQANIGHYERGQTVLPDVAKKLIAFAASKGAAVTYEDIYGAAVETAGLAKAA